MDQVSPTFPTLRRWRGMSESEQDALLNKIEARRRWRRIGSRALVAILCVGAMAAGIAFFAAS